MSSKHVFFFEQEKNGKLSFLDVEVPRGKGKFVLAIYRSLLFVVCTPISNVSCQQYTNLVCFILLLIAVSEFVLIGQSFMKNLVFKGSFFKKDGYPLPFIDNCFKTFVDKLFKKRLQLTTVQKKTSFCHYHTLEKFPY